MKESAVLEDLEKLAQQQGIRITTANLKKCAYYIKSGLCRVDGQYRIILDKHLHLSEKIDVLIDSLQHFQLDTSWLDPTVRRLLEKKTRAGQPALEYIENIGSEELTDLTTAVPQ